MGDPRARGDADLVSAFVRGILKGVSVSFLPPSKKEKEKKTASQILLATESGIESGRALYLSTAWLCLFCSGRKSNLRPQTGFSFAFSISCFVLSLLLLLLLFWCFYGKANFLKKPYLCCFFLFCFLTHSLIWLFGFDYKKHNDCLHAFLNDVFPHAHLFEHIGPWGMWAEHS